METSLLERKIKIVSTLVFKFGMKVWKRRILWIVATSANLATVYHTEKDKGRYTSCFVVCNINSKREFPSLVARKFLNPRNCGWLKTNERGIRILSRAWSPSNIAYYKNCFILLSENPNSYCQNKRCKIHNPLVCRFLFLTTRTISTSQISCEELWLRAVWIKTQNAKS